MRCPIAERFRATLYIKRFRATLYIKRHTYHIDDEKQDRAAGMSRKYQPGFSFKPVMTVTRVRGDRYGQ